MAGPEGILEPLTFTPTKAFRRVGCSPVIRFGPCLVALTLAFPAPGSAFGSADDGAVVETFRSARNDRRSEQSKRRRRGDPESLPCGSAIVRCFEALNRCKPADEWTPGLYSRPPPSA
jgi:hypothetical protein